MAALVSFLPDLALLPATELTSFPPCSLRPHLPAACESLLAEVLGFFELHLFDDFGFLGLGLDVDGVLGFL